MLLQKIDSPEDLKKLSIRQLGVLAAEIRSFLLQTVSRTGGHLASNLGVVELTIALHYCLNSPRDKIVWDVGHQTYPHKILTGRRDALHTLRSFGGLSGFAKSAESGHDAFDTGHSSTSLSAAFGMAAARDLMGQSHKVAAVIGDGGLTGGLALEGLNNIGRSKTDIIVVLNDNQMSIAKNVGALSYYLNHLRTNPSYLSAKRDVREFLSQLPLGGAATRNLIEKAKNQLKYVLLPGVLFEELGLRYYGPVNGHNLEHLVASLQNIKRVKGPVLLHVRTRKGKGHPPAEARPRRFHAVEPFGVFQKEITYTDIFAKKIVEIGHKNKSVVAITASMPDGAGLAGFKQQFGPRFFDVGIAESHGVTFAAGLAKAGLRPVCAIYSTFLQRSYDQILHDCCIQNLPVVFAIDRAGAVAADGETHQGAFDLSYLAQMPNMTVLAPKNGAELAHMLDFAFKQSGPVAIRYPKEPVADCYTNKTAPIVMGKWEILEDGSDTAILAVGSMVNTAAKVRRKLLAIGHAPMLINARFVKPLDEAMLETLAGFKHIVTMEENVADGGFGQRVAHFMQRRVKTFTLPDAFLPAGTRRELLTLAGLDFESIFDKIKLELDNEAP